LVRVDLTKVDFIEGVELATSISAICINFTKFVDLKGVNFGIRNSCKFTLD